MYFLQFLVFQSCKKYNFQMSYLFNSLKINELNTKSSHPALPIDFTEVTNWHYLCSYYWQKVRWEFEL